MPTPESAGAFAKLVAARTRLAEVTKLINECHARLSTDGLAERQRYEQLQTEWDEAFKDFQDATGEFTVTMNRLREDVDAQRLPKS